MKRKRFSGEQIVAVLKQAELGLPVADLIRKIGISEQTFYRWKKQYAGLESDQVRESKQLSEEKARLNDQPSSNFCHALSQTFAFVRVQPQILLRQRCDTNLALSK